MKPVQKVLDDADLQKNQVDEIVLVGGSTRILKIQQLVKDFFSGKVSLLLLFTLPAGAVANSVHIWGSIIPM